MKNPRKAGPVGMGRNGHYRKAAPTLRLSRASSLVYGGSLCVDFSRLKVFVERRAGDWLAAERRGRAASGSAPCAGHQEHRRPSTSVPTDARGCRSTVQVSQSPSRGIVTTPVRDGESVFPASCQRRRGQQAGAKKAAGSGHGEVEIPETNGRPTPRELAPTA